jgi:capsule polysaccharide modification protein KpsS
LALDNGNFAAQPNNRILWNVSNYTVSREWPDYKVQTTYWSVENKDWITEDTDKMFYEIQNPPDDSNKI